MKTETVELTKVEIQYLINIVNEHIHSGEYWGNQNQFYAMQERVFDKLEEAYELD
jgi:hypothetical protein